MIVQRKQELSVDKIRQLNAGYEELFDRFKGRYQDSEYHKVENTNLDNTISLIINAYRNAA